MIKETVDAVRLAELEGEKEMADTVAKCEKYNEEQQKEIDLKVMQLKNKSYEKMDGTVKAIVEYLF